MATTKYFEWDSDKKIYKLIEERGVGFEEIVIAIQNGHLLGIVQGKTPKYIHQRILSIFIDGYT